MATKKGFEHLERINFHEINKELQGCIYLEDSFIDLFGYKVYGTPYQPVYSDSAFQRSSNVLKNYWQKIPTDTDILITHSPPFGIRDMNRKGMNGGCPDLAAEIINRVKPIYHLYGHIHESYGIEIREETTFINASFCATGYMPINPPFMFELPRKDKPSCNNFGR